MLLLVEKTRVHGLTVATSVKIAVKIDVRGAVPHTLHQRLLFRAISLSLTFNGFTVLC